MFLVFFKFSLVVLTTQDLWWSSRYAYGQVILKVQCAKGNILHILLIRLWGNKAKIRPIDKPNNNQCNVKEKFCIRGIRLKIIMFYYGNWGRWRRQFEVVPGLNFFHGHDFGPYASDKELFFDIALIVVRLIYRSNFGLVSSQPH